MEISFPPKRKHWTQQEDQAIHLLLQRYSGIKWTEIAKKLVEEFGLEGRTGKQCRERWLNHLCPDIKKDAWTSEEQVVLLKLHIDLGNYWARISTFLPGRSENSVKNKFYSLLRRQFRKFKGCEPTRKDLKNNDSALTTQLLSSLGKKIHCKAVANIPKFEKVVVIQETNPKTIDLLPPIEHHSEHSTLLDEQDFFVPISHYIS